MWPVAVGTQPLTKAIKAESNTAEKIFIFMAKLFRLQAPGVKQECNQSRIKNEKLKMKISRGWKAAALRAH
jgi:hypothetical protein